MASKKTGKTNNSNSSNNNNEKEQSLFTLPDNDIYFSIFDNFINDEASEQTDAIVYFYPTEEKDAQKKVLFGGMIQSIVGAIADFFSRKTKIDYVRFDKHIMAYKFVDTYTLALCASKLIPSSTVIDHLNYIYNAFTLYCKSFKEVKIKENRINMNSVLEETMQIVKSDLYKNRMKSFQPLPYTPLPPTSNRIFLRASQTIHNIIFPDHLGGAIFVKNNLLFSTIDLDITRHILDKIEYTREKTQTISNGSIPNDMSITVYISPHHCDQLIQYKLDYMDSNDQYQQQQQQHHNMNQFNNNNNNNNNMNTSMDTDQIDPIKEESETFIPVELLLLFWKDVTVAVLTQPVANTARYINKIKNLLISSEIDSLERDPVLQNPNIISHTTISPSNNYSYHFLSYDSLTQMATASGMSSESEEIFISTCGSIHNTLNENPNITQMFLRNQNGEIFCKKQFGREVYYQPRQSSTNAFVENCETHVQEVLRDHNINIL